MRTEGEEELPQGEGAAPHPAWGEAGAAFRARKQRGHLLPAVGGAGRGKEHPMAGLGGHVEDTGF